MESFLQDRTKLTYQQIQDIKKFLEDNHFLHEIEKAFVVNSDYEDELEDLEEEFEDLKTDHEDLKYDYYQLQGKWELLSEEERQYQNLQKRFTAIVGHGEDLVFLIREYIKKCESQQSIDDNKKTIIDLKKQINKRLEWIFWSGLLLVASIMYIFTKI